MTWGRGEGEPFGGELEDVEQPLSEIAGEPTGFDLTDEADGPLPGLWAAYALAHDGAGGVAWSDEAAPATYFRIADGFGLWQYERAPALPGVNDPYTERGFAAGPGGVIEGRNVRAAVAVRQPLLLLDTESDEFVFEVGLALRLDPTRARWVGARMRAVWAGGSWTTPFVLEALKARGEDPEVLDSVVPPSEPTPLNLWSVQPLVALEVELRGAELVATVGGVVEVTCQVPGDDFASQVAILAQVYNRVGSTITPVSCIAGAHFQALRDIENLGPPPQIPGALHLEAPDFPMMSLPLRQLLDSRAMKQLRGRQFQFTEDAEVTVGHQTFRFKQGEIVRAREKVGTQELVPTTRDLHAQRTKDR